MGTVLEMSIHKRPVTFILITLMALTACGNQPDRGKALEIAKGLANRTSRISPTLPSAEELTQGITAALENTKKPLALAHIEDRKNVTLLTEVSMNGPYSTWVSPDRRTLSEQQGMIISSRGLGADLMAAKVDPSLQLIRTKKSGTADRTHVYLDGENHEVVMRLSCKIKISGTETLSIGEIRSHVTELSELCTGEGVSFENTYKVTPAGRIVQSRQWLGAKNGYVTIQKLR